MIYITSDHAGFKLKQEILKNPKFKDIFTDLGPFEYDGSDNYPDFVGLLVRKINEDKGSKGIILCKNGVGVSVMANKFKGIRAGLSWNPAHVKTARNDDDINVLALPAHYINKKQAYRIIEDFLNTSFSSEDRHSARLDVYKDLGS